jgi:hypothetical protein
MDLEKQHQHLLEYKINPIELGNLCERYPALKNSWNQFLTVLEMCKENDIKTND